MGAPEVIVTCEGGTCAFACLGESYDVNENQADGCETSDEPAGHHTREWAQSAGSLPCSDSMSNPEIAGIMPSDAWPHVSPAIDGFNAASGSSPDWYVVRATGGLCSNNISLTLRVTDSSNLSCYRLTVETDRNTLTCSTNTTGTCTVTSGTSSYGDDTNIYIAVDKTCDTSVVEAATYTVTGHL